MSDERVAAGRPDAALTAQSSWLGYEMLVAAIAILAMVVADTVHEILGHVTVSAALGDHITRISSVGIQTVGTFDRAAASAGTLANLLTGAASLICLRLGGPFRASTTKLFLWLFGAFSLFNSGYLVFSAVAASGDWQQVIAGLTPAWLWRSLLGLVGVLLYYASWLWVMNVSPRVFANASRGRRRLAVWTAYLAAALVATAAATLNPYNPTLVLVSGLGLSLGLNWGILFLPESASEAQRTGSNGDFALAGNWPWLALGLLAGGLFIGVFGPGFCVDCSVK